MTKRWWIQIAIHLLGIIYESKHNFELLVLKTHPTRDAAFLTPISFPFTTHVKGKPNLYVVPCYLGTEKIVGTNSVQREQAHAAAATLLKLSRSQPNNWLLREITWRFHVNHSKLLRVCNINKQANKQGLATTWICLSSVCALSKVPPTTTSEGLSKIETTPPLWKLKIRNPIAYEFVKADNLVVNSNVQKKHENTASSQIC